MNEHNQKPTDMFNKQDLTAYLTYIKILKDQNILNVWLHIPEVILILWKWLLECEVEKLVYFNLLIF